MSKILTMSGAEGAVTPAPTSSLPMGWSWKHILAVVGGSFAIAGGGTLAVLGFTRSKTAWKWGGLVLVGAGVVTIGVAWWMAHMNQQGMASVLLGGRMPADNPRVLPRAPEKHDLVALVDGRQARVNEFTKSLDGSRSYNVRFVENGTLTAQDEWIKDVQVAGVVAT